MTPAAERMIYTRGYQNGYKAIRRAGKEQREQRIEELENENVGVKEQRDSAESRVETLKNALREIGLALSTFAPCESVGGCGHRPTCVEIATIARRADSALKETP